MYGSPVVVGAFALLSMRLLMFLAAARGGLLTVMWISGGSGGGVVDVLGWVPCSRRPRRFGDGPKGGSSLENFVSRPRSAQALALRDGLLECGRVWLTRRMWASPHLFS